MLPIGRRRRRPVVAGRLGSVRRRPLPSSPGTDRADRRGERTAMVIKARRAVLTERCRLMCKQRGCQQETTSRVDRSPRPRAEHRRRRGTVQRPPPTSPHPRNGGRIGPSHSQPAGRQRNSRISRSAAATTTLDPCPNRSTGLLARNVNGVTFTCPAAADTQPLHTVS
jgi:hypothetical protein